MVDGRQSDACAEYVLDARALPEQGVDDGRSLGNQRRLAQEAQDGQHGVEALEVLRGGGAELDALAQLGDDDEVEHEGAGEQGVLAGVVDDDGVGATHHDLGRVLVHGALAVAHARHVLDHHAVVGLLTLPVQDAVRLHHVVDHVALRHLKHTRPD